jgi:hypothetical protein
MPQNTPHFNQLLLDLDFPRSSAWRLMTDGWLHHKGPKAFRPEFYRGMEAGFEALSQHRNNPLTTTLLETFHDSAYQFEPRYIGYPDDEKPKLQGFRDKRGTEFSIYLATDKKHEEAGLSLAGLDEFVDSLIQAWKSRVRMEYDNEDFMKLPSCEKDHMEIAPWSVIVGHPVGETEVSYIITDQFFEKNGTEARAALKEFLLKNFKQAAEGPAGGTSIRILAGPLPKKEIEKLINQTIVTANQAILGEVSQDKKIEAVVRSTRTNHQGHYFADGNGRAFVFLMTNFNLLKSGLGLTFMRNPAHFGGYSSAELSAEVKAGLANFNEYKITAAKSYLNSLSADAIVKKSAEVQVGLNASLARDPLIALEQLNELFVQIKTNQLLVPRNYYPRLDNQLTNFFYSSTPNKAHHDSLVLLKSLYLEKVEAYLKTLPKENQTVDLTQSYDARELGNTSVKQVFLDMIDHHELLDDELYPPSKVNKKTRPLLNQAIEAHFQVKVEKEEKVEQTATSSAKPS